MKSHQQVLRSIRLPEASAKMMQEIQNGLWFFRSANIKENSSSLKPYSVDEEILKGIAFGSSLMFCEPLKFIVLREHDGYGWTSISGPEEFIEGLQKNTSHKLYKWEKGPLPLDTTGGREPKNRAKLTSPEGS